MIVNFKTILFLGLACLITSSTGSCAFAQETTETHGVRMFTWYERDGRILTVLEKDAKIDYFEKHFGDIVDDLKLRYKIPIRIDESSADNNLDKDAVMTVSLSNVSLNSALSIMLEPYQCEAVVDKEVLVIMSQEKAKQTWQVRVYDCRELVKKLGGSAENYASLINVLKSTVDPRSWDVNGGDAGAAALKGRLIVRQNAPGHKSVARLLNSLSKDFSK